MQRGRQVASLLGLIATALLASAAAPVRPFAQHVFQVTLSGAQEVPPVVTAGSGTVSVTLDDVTGAVSVSGQFSGLSSNATLAHIHGPAPAGGNAGVVLTLTETGGTSGSVTGSGVLTPPQVADLLNGLNYVNIHTATNGGGEIRGQIVNAVPAMSWGWMAALALAAVLVGAFALTRRQPSPAGVA